MKSKEKDIAKTICNEIFSSIGKLLVKGAEEAFVSGEYEIYKSGKQAGLYEAKKAVKGVLEGYLREESIKKVEVDGFTQIEGSEIEKEKLYSELFFATIRNGWGDVPIEFYNWLNNRRYGRDKFGIYSKVIPKKFIQIIFYNNYYEVQVTSKEGLVFNSGVKNTTLTDFKKILEEAEGCTLPNEVEKEKLYSEIKEPFVDWLKENCYYGKDGAVFVQKHITSLIVYVIFYKKNFSVLAYYEGWLVFDSGLKNTTLTDFKKIIEEAENCTPPTNGEK